jgi:HSP20 family protein
MAGTIAKPKQEKEIATNAPTGMRDIPSLMRYMQCEFDELFHRFARNWPMSIEDFSRHWSWGMSIDDQDDCVIVRAEAPGFEASDFDLRVTGDRLVLRANRKNEKKEKQGESLEERRCYESMILPPGVDTDKMDASYRDGVLTITIPKTVEGRGKKIDIKSH